MNTLRRHNYPLVNTDDILVMVWRDHLMSGALPVLFLQALGSGGVVGELRSGPDLDIDAFTITLSISVPATGEVQQFNLPVGAFDPLNKVTVLRLTRGRVSADLRSPGEFRTYFKQPTDLAGTTKNSGGWPTAP